MLTHPTLDKLHALQWMGMYQALLEQTQMPEITDGPAGRSGNHRPGGPPLKTRLHKAKLRHTACIEDIDYRHPRGLDKSLRLSLATCQWIRDRHNVLITGPTGLGKPQPGNYPSRAERIT